MRRAILILPNSKRLLSSLWRTQTDRRKKLPSTLRTTQSVHA